MGSTKNNGLSAVHKKFAVRIKRVYDPPAPTDGCRVLIDRLWPRGVKKEDAAIDIWAKELAPSSQLRKWFGHDNAKCDEFKRRYREELSQRSAAIEQLIVSTQGRPLTLVYGAKNTHCNNAVVLGHFLEQYVQRQAPPS